LTLTVTLILKARGRLLELVLQEGMPTTRPEVKVRVRVRVSVLP